MLASEDRLDADGPEPGDAGAARAGWAARLWRAVRLTLLAAAGLLAAAFVSSLTVDLGPTLRARAETAGSRQIERPLHIGRLSVQLFRGHFVVEDLVIEGLSPDDRPFLTAERIVLSVPWWSLLLRRELLFESVEMADWRMLVETFEGGRHNFPRFTRGEPASGPRRFVTTVQYVRAMRGEFVYEDHGTPWSVTAPGLDLTITKIRDYRGRASFTGGLVRIRDFEPMGADLSTNFKLEGGRVLLDRIALRTDGAESALTGEVDLAHWPEQLYQVRSRVQFPRMREIFFADDAFSLAGEGEFVGSFHLFRGGRELKGDFRSALAGLNNYRFPNLEGSLVWTEDRFEVQRATSDLYGGAVRFTFGMAPLGAPTPGTARFVTSYTDVDLVRVSDALAFEGIRLAGAATGENRLEWPIGRFHERRGDGRITVQPPPGTRLMRRLTPAALDVEAGPAEPPVGPFNPDPALGHVAIGGAVEYRVGPEWIEIGASQVATARTFVAFEGRTAYGERSRIPFHVTSADWQESDRVLAGILTLFGAGTRAVPVWGHGTFDGVMVGAFRAPRIEGDFVAPRIRAWDVEWGSAQGSVVIENAYADVTGGRVRAGDSEVLIDGRFSLGFPRRDGGEEINARVRIGARPVVDLRLAFGIEDYDVDGALSGEFHVYGQYTRPFGFGRMTIEPGVAYGEPFETATAGLRFEGAGVRLDGLRIIKGGGTITGAAYVGWDGTYSFNADARRIPMEAVAAVRYPRAPLTGLLQLSASGAGSFDAPRYDVRGRIDDLFVLDEGIGQVNGRLGVRGEVLTLELEAASPRLAVSGSGRIALTPQADAELTFRFTDTSLDPYVRAFEPRLSPFTQAVVSGALRVVGELRDLQHLLVDATVEQLDLSLFDYRLTNREPIRIALDRARVRIDEMHLSGESTELDLTGEIRLDEERLALRARGDANLGILQGFFRDLRSAGRAELVADLEGPLSAPVVGGRAEVAEGRVRHFSLPHGLEAVNGRITFDADGIHLDELTGSLGGGRVRFGGRIGLKGFTPGELAVTATGDGMQLRYPEGFRSRVDAELSLRGDLASPVLAGTVNVRDALWVRRFDTGTGLFDFGGARDEAPGAPSAAGEPAVPLRFDLRILAPSTLRIENSAARIVSSAELTLRGTYDRPLLFGHAAIERGEVLFEGNRYVVTRGSIDFTNPVKVEPFFDIEAETRVRVPGQTYRVVFHAAGTAERFVPDLSSDPPLPTVDILSLLFGDARDPQDAELRALQAPNEAEQKLIQARAARLLASPISSEVGRVVERTLSVDTFQITPSLGDFSSQQAARLNPSARLTIGKRISDRVFLTFSRALNAANRDLIILLEYNQTDRLSWVVSQNEDRTYALDFRVRHVF